MNSSSTQFVPSGRMGFYEPIHQIDMWTESFKVNGIPNLASSSIMAGNLDASASRIMPPNTKFEKQSEDTSQVTLGAYDQEASKPANANKMQRRLAQNRVAARKSRLRKKAYVQQLETSRLKLIQLEQELRKARQQAGNNGVYLGGAVEASSLGYSAVIAPGISLFERQYLTWVDEQNRLIFELRTALNAHRTEEEFRPLVERAMKHYFDLFLMKSTAAEADVFYLIYGVWKTPAERFFLWIGGFRPSEILKVIKPQLDDLTDEQYTDVCNLENTSQQAEEALKQGMDKLKLTLAESVVAGQLDEASCFPRVETAMDKLNGLVRFVQQADHVRQVILGEMYKVLTFRQTARGLLALGEYFQRLRGLSSLLASRSHGHV